MKRTFFFALLFAGSALAAQQSLPHDSTSKRQALLLNVSELLNGGFGLTYTCEFAHHRLDVLVPVSVGIGAPSFSNSSRNKAYDNDNHISGLSYSRKVFDAAVGINYHTNPAGKATYFIGLLAGAAQFNGSCNYFGIYNAPSDAKTYHFVMTSSYAMINNGFILRINKRLEVLGYLASGIKADNYSHTAPAGLFQQTQFKYINGNIPNPFSNVKIGFNVGYKF